MESRQVLVSSPVWYNIDWNLKNNIFQKIISFVGNSKKLLKIAHLKVHKGVFIVLQIQECACSSANRIFIENV